MRVRLTVTPRSRTATARAVACTAFKVGGKGKPVRIRRGPATVTGRSRRSRDGSHWDAPLPGRRGEVGPEARRPPPAEQLIRPRGKGWLHAQTFPRSPSRSRLSDPLAGTRRGGDRPVRVEGLTDTSSLARASTTTSAPVVKDGNPAHSCSGDSAAGAVEIASGGEWDGPWSDAFQYGLVTIKGVSYPFDPPSSYTGKYWSIYLNGYAAPSGICGFDLQPADSLVVAAINDSDPNGLLNLSGVPLTAAPGSPVTVTVNRSATTYSPPDFLPVNSEEPAKDATVQAGGTSATAGADGKATLTLTQRGPVAIRATKAARSAPQRRASASPTAPTATAARSSRGANVADLAAGRGAERRRRPRRPVRLGRLDPRAAALQARQGAARAQRHRGRRAVGIKDIALRLTRHVGKRCDGSTRRASARVKRPLRRRQLAVLLDRRPHAVVLPAAAALGPRAATSSTSRSPTARATCGAGHARRRARAAQPRRVLRRLADARSPCTGPAPGGARGARRMRAGRGRRFGRGCPAHADARLRADADRGPQDRGRARGGDRDAPAAAQLPRRKDALRRRLRPVHRRAVRRGVRGASTGSTS